MLFSQILFTVILMTRFSVARADAPAAALAHPIPTLSDSAGTGALIKLDLDGAIARAIEAATAIQKAKNGVELSGVQLVQGYAQFLPNLQAVGAYNALSGRQYLITATPAIVDGRTRSATYQLSTTLNLFNGFADYASLEASLARRRSTDLTLKRARQQIALDVEQSFLQVTLDQQIVKIALKNLSSSQARERLLTEQARVGVRNSADLYRQQAQTSSDEAYLVNAQNKERSDELLLVRKLRLDAAGRYEFIEPTLTDRSREERFRDEGHLVELALAERPDLKAQVNGTKALEWDVTTARASYFPRLDFGASFAGAGRTIDSQTLNGAAVSDLPTQGSLLDQMQNQTVSTIGVTLTWNIFDRWSTRAATSRASVTASNARLDEQDLRNQVIAEVRQAFGDYRAVLQQLESSRKGYTAASKAYEVVDGRYKVGSANFVDLAAAQAVLAQADSARAQALISFALQTRILETVCGIAQNPKPARNPQISSE